MDARVSSVAIFCISPYLSLFVHESFKHLKAVDPGLAASLSATGQEVIARSRHSLKLFEDTHRGVQGQLSYFRDEVISAHKGRFLGRTWFPLARALETDLGLYTYRGVPISSTHAATFLLGYDPKQLLAPRPRPDVRTIAEEYGRYFGILGAGLDPQAESFASVIEPRGRPSQRQRQPPPVGRRPRFIHRQLGRVLVNFVDILPTLDPGLASRQTIFKIRFLTVYAVLRSLEVLLTEHWTRLTKGSLAALNATLAGADAKLLKDAPRAFRNTLMHYGLDARISLAALDLRRPLYGLIQSCFAGHDDRSLAEALDRQVAHTATTLNAWGGR
jgi:hypothetical protein